MPGNFFFVNSCQFILINLKLNFLLWKKELELLALCYI